MSLAATVIILVLAMIYGYINGVHGSGNVVATMISSRALGPRQALALTALGLTLGPFLLGVAVASTIGAQLVSPQTATSQVVTAGLLGAITWTTITLRLKIPSSISQAMVGGLIGAVWTSFGPEAILLPGLQKTLAALFLSPFCGLLVGFLVVRLCYWLFASATPHVNRWFNWGQVLVSLLVAISFGANNGQIIMGIMTLGLVTTRVLSSFVVPEWVVILSAIVSGLGALVGGSQLIHPLSGKFYKIRPVHGFSAQLASGSVILGTGLLGGPVSGSQVITSAILGAGSADRMQMIRWGLARQIAISWLLTLPVSAIVGSLFYVVLEKVRLS